MAAVFQEEKKQGLPGQLGGILLLPPYSIDKEVLGSTQIQGRGGKHRLHVVKVKQQADVAEECVR